MKTSKKQRMKVLMWVFKTQKTKKDREHPRKKERLSHKTSKIEGSLIFHICICVPGSLNFRTRKFFEVHSWEFSQFSIHFFNVTSLVEQYFKTV